MGDRKDATLVRDIDGMHGLMAHVKPYRADSDVYINQKIDVTELVKYYDKLKKDNPDIKYTYFHMFCTAFGKTVYNRPLLNRFVINKKYYDRKDITISFVAKREFTDESEENFSVIKVEKNDNIHTLRDKISGQVKNIRSSKLNNADKFMEIIGKLPKFFKSIITFIIKFADNHDLLPESLTKDSIYHTSVIVSNLGSINCGAIYHNLTDFGTNSILITMGEIKDEPIVINGKVEIRKMCEFGVNLDERIADGFYFVKSLKVFEHILQNPKLLEDDANTKIEI
ncbi:MAG: 2-oxo acid dehydrogenase subunit E2 [Bacilli bacterium]|nr:2-oxo acid dehydrogenase subunit E2 [Bacilli bacterium]